MAEDAHVSAAEVVFEHVVKRYPGRAEPAVSDLSLRVPAGEICMLVGPSGGGKTTALKLVNRLIDLTDGDIKIGGDSIRSLEPVQLRRRIGYVIQQVGLFPHLTVGGNIATVPRLLGWQKERIGARVDELLELVGLDREYAGRYPAQLSGGQRQRVGLARAMAADPLVMLMDEPFGALDPITRDRLQNEFLRLHRQVRKTVIFVTHDIDEAIKMGDRIAILREGGVLAQYDTPDELLAHPVDDFVARFVGADRGLKRLSLRRVGELDLIPAPAARPGDDAAEARERVEAAGFETLIVVDGDGRPTGRLPISALGGEQVTEDGVLPIDALADTDTSLRDALSMMLTATGSHLVVVDADGRYLGLTSADLISQELAGAKAGAGRVPA
jgi:osmoprotectant transport system ATP-binding protein